MPPTRPQSPLWTPLDAIVKQTGAGVTGLAGEEPAQLSGLTLDSRAVQPGDLYVASPGAATHGARFARAAADAGAAAVLTDDTGAELCRSAGLEIPVLVVPRPRSVLGGLSALIYGNPAADLRLFAVTGTQGKTTTTRLAEAALQAAGVPMAVVGTVGTRIDGEDVVSALTTPEAPDLHALFAVMRERGIRGCAMEVSSHALVMGRVDGVVFDVAAFTNLGRDHLDFHTDMEDYYAAKAQLFTAARARRALVNLDDGYGRRLAEEVTQAGEIPLRTYAVNQSEADWRAVQVQATATGSTFLALGPDIEVQVEIVVPGDFNVSNALCALAGLTEAGFEPQAVAEGLSRVHGVPGRLEAVDVGQDFLAVVDYAHKPDAIDAVLRSLRERTSGRLLVVLGAGGDRDRGKRPLMGQVAGTLADVVVVTDDNPRTEEPAAIRAEVRDGLRGTAAEVHEEGDRRTAIALAVGLAAPGDCVVVAGKGHETGQEVDGTVHPFDDRVALREALLAVAAGRDRGATEGVER